MISKSSSNDGSLPNGVWPVMLTPFTQEGEVDFESLQRLTDWYIEAGSAGLFTCCLSSEIFHLSEQEKRDIARCVIQHTAGRVPVVAGAIGQKTLEDRLAASHWFNEQGAVAVILDVAEFADEKDPEEVAVHGLLAFAEQLPGVRLGIYECPKPYHRVLSAEGLRRLAETGRFVMSKDTCCRSDLFAEKMDAIRDLPLKLYEAHSPIILDCLRAGGHGFCGVGANLMPQAYVWLCRNFADHPKQAERVQEYLQVVHQITHNQYPANVKQYHVEHGRLRSNFCRQAIKSTGEPQPIQLDSIHEQYLQAIAGSA